MVALGLAFSCLGIVSAAAATHIKALPFVCNSKGETYVLDADLRLDRGDAIVVVADEVVIDGNGRTVVFADGGPGTGIAIDAPITSLEIKNIVLVQGGYDPDSGERVNGIFRNGDFSGLRIHDNKIHIRHSGAKPNALGRAIALVNNGDRTRNVEVYRNSIVVEGTSAGLGITLDAGSASIHDNSVTMMGIGSSPAGYGRALAVSGSGPVDILGNRIVLDKKCDTIQGISLWGARNATVRDNVINSEANHARSILIDGDSDHNRIVGNRVTMMARHESGDASAGIRVRFGSDHNLVIQNKIDASKAVNSYPLRIGGEDTRGGRFPELKVPSGNIFRENVLRSSSRVVSLEDNASKTAFFGNKIEAVGSRAVAVYVNGDFEETTFQGDVIKGPIEMVDGESETRFCDTNVTRSQIHIARGAHRFDLRSRACSSGK
jgi:hypothetical protein